ncbi:hypothetical protein BP5796_04873 [Coleophoma crateriformis]|uniref:Uncharacterized protein n=1 Tax=Coleophoma crateriformis TaxID=565419 RepID=A0A3D8SAH9_9HELO|nr:hypothetical protein BP5796_04873 [Coleophoma crateriformis]
MPSHFGTNGSARPTGNSNTQSHSHGGSLPSYPAPPPASSSSTSALSLLAMQQTQSLPGYARHPRRIENMPNCNPFEGQRRALDPYNCHPNFGKPRSSIPPINAQASAMQITQSLPGYAGLATNTNSSFGASVKAINNLSRPTHFLVPTSETHLYSRHWKTTSTYPGSEYVTVYLDLQAPTPSLPAAVRILVPASEFHLYKGHWSDLGPCLRKGYVAITLDTRTACPSLSVITAYLPAPAATASPPAAASPSSPTVPSPAVAVSPIFQRFPLRSPSPTEYPSIASPPVVHHKPKS